MTEDKKTERLRSGFVTILGRPNVGKSTLMNQLIGEKVAIISPRPQTTRTRIQGVVNRAEQGDVPAAQIVFVDTPGLQRPRNKLGEYMESETWGSFDGVELILYLVNAFEGLSKGDLDAIERLSARNHPPVLLAVNQIDRVGREKLIPLLAKAAEFELFEAVAPISALTGEGLDELWGMLVARMPEGPRYFPEDMITDQPERLLVAELIREKALLHLREEVPHGVGVEVSQMSHDETGHYEIQVTLYCEKASHKSIIIGKNGQMLRTIGSEAREDIQRLLAAKVHLETWVKVKPGWRNSMATLRTLGYE